MSLEFFANSTSKAITLKKSPRKHHNHAFLPVFCENPGTKDALQFLMTREITHLRAFMAALDSMGKDSLSIGEIPPTPGVVDQFFNDSSGTNGNGERDFRGPWNEGDGVEYVEAPAKLETQVTQEQVTREISKAAKRRS